MFFLIIFLSSMLVVALAIPPIIRVSFQKRLFDDPSETRKVHKRITPNFGGIAIFSGFLLTCALFIPSALLPQANIIMAGGLILFMTGLKDDIVGLSPLIKFVAQFTVAFIVTLVGDLRIENLHGIFGLGELTYAVSVGLSVLFIVGVVNAFNLIDGIDGLAASLGIVISLFFAFLFYKQGNTGWSYLALTLSGSLLGFLFFNVSPAKIFMGDSGSLNIGFVICVLSLKFMSATPLTSILFEDLHLSAPIALTLAILIIPIFDTLRVFTLRIIRNTSPFTADSNHLHHRLLFLRLSHMQASLVLVVINMLFVILALSLQHLGEAQVIFAIAATILALNGLFSLYLESYKKSLFSPKSTVNIDDVLLAADLKDNDRAPTKLSKEELLDKIVEN